MSARRILILRHGKSAWDDTSLDDFDRPLAGRGRRAAAAIGAYMADEGLVPDLVLCSAARRAVETWDTVARVAGMDAETVTEDGLYLAAAQTLLDRCRSVDDAIGTVLLVGHHPGHDGFAQLLAGANGPKAELRRMREKYPTGALAVVDLPDGPWSRLAPGIGLLERFVTPKDLL